MKELVAHIAEALVDNPDQVKVVENENGDMINIELTVAQEDLGNGPPVQTH